jgi:hypothetical protein
VTRPQTQTEGNNDGWQPFGDCHHPILKLLKNKLQQ